jgi:hypothetical protein
LDDPQVAAAPFSGPRNYLRLFAETNGGPLSDQVYTRAQAVALARRFDMIVGLRWTFDDYVRDMKRANPRLRIIVYLHGATSRAGDRGSMPEAWFLHDRNGHRIRNVNFNLTYTDVGTPRMAELDGQQVRGVARAELPRLY